MLNRIVQEVCRTAGSRAALVFENERYTYAQLEEQVARCAAGLRRSGVDPESGVALVLKNSPEFVFAYLAASRLGAPAYLVDSGSKASEFRRLFTENQVAVTVCEPEQFPSIEQRPRRDRTALFHLLARGKLCGLDGHSDRAASVPDI